MYSNRKQRCRTKAPKTTDSLLSERAGMSTGFQDCNKKHAQDNKAHTSPSFNNEPWFNLFIIGGNKIFQLPKNL